MPQPARTRSQFHIHRTPQTTLLPYLHSHLPYSLPVYRRIQYEIFHPTSTAVVISTLPAGSPSPSGNDRANGVPISEVWMTAHIDLFRGRETQVYVYSSLERGSSRPSKSGRVRGDENGSEEFIARFDTASDESLTIAQTQLFSLLRYIKEYLLPEYLASTPSSNEAAAEAEAETNIPSQANPIPKIPLSPPSSILLGTVHTGLLGLLSVSGVYPDKNPAEGVRILRMDVTCSKYVFSSETYSSPTLGEGGVLPEGYTFSARGPYESGIGFGGTTAEAALVNSRTRIYRSRESLGKMSGVAIYAPVSSRQTAAERQAIAWAFVTFDGSLATLHVEQEHRGKGLAGCLIQETSRRAMGEEGMFGGLDGEGFVHVDVESGNGASSRVMEKGGGRLEWTDGWVVVDVEGL